MTRLQAEVERQMSDWGHRSRRLGLLCKRCNDGEPVIADEVVEAIASLDVTVSAIFCLLREIAAKGSE